MKERRKKEKGERNHFSWGRREQEEELEVKEGLENSNSIRYLKLFEILTMVDNIL
jgi:hypothetical protein